jgi:hypothetical protein
MAQSRCSFYILIRYARDGPCPPGRPGPAGPPSPWHGPSPEDGRPGPEFVTLVVTLLPLSPDGGQGAVAPAWGPGRCKSV